MKQVLLMIAVVALVGCGTTKVDPNALANISDPIVEKVVRRVFIKPTGELTNEDLAKVTRLDLSRTKITDAGLKDLAKLKKLTRLHLNGTKITEAGLKDLAKLQNLTYLDLRSTKITDEGAAWLRKALPECKRFFHSYKKD